MAEGLGKLRWPSSRVRETFIQYFVRHKKLPHVFVPSSSIVPKNDPTLAFTNAGMNQFKDVILGYGGPPKYPRAVNSQKCLRINDLDLVGTDTYHQTFFEMLGNWSFSNYFKTEACTMAWDLLTNVYKIDPNRLYVTYYAGGSNSESVPVDLETLDIWRNIVGVPESRILPFGKENFWAMGPVGPCGPSTEIHYDHRGTGLDGGSEVNGDSGKVVELWNLVFMQYNRTEGGSLERLPLSHVVDTGAGLERLTAVLNEKESNYETDLFFPIFQKIQKLSGKAPYSSSFESSLDLSYRVFADHMRATTVALSDGVLPQTNQKIRRLIQRSLDITGNHFIPRATSSMDIVDFLGETVESVAQTLSAAFPEIEKMKVETISILAHEVLRYLELLKSHASKKNSGPIPFLVAADFPQLAKIPKKELEGAINAGRIDGKTAFSWYERHGVGEDALEELAISLGLQFDPQEMKGEFNKVKNIFRDDVAKQIIRSQEKLFVRKVESTLASTSASDSSSNSSKTSLKNQGPVIIDWIFDLEGNSLEETKRQSSFWIVLNSSPFLPGNPSLESDVGFITLESKNKNRRLRVSEVVELPSGVKLHRIEIGSDGFDPDLEPIRKNAAVIEISVDTEKKLGRQMSGEALVYLKIWLKRKYGVVRFGSESVLDKEVKLGVTVLHGDFGFAEMEECQLFLNDNDAPIVVTRRTKKKGGEFEIVCATGLAAEVAMRYGWEINKAVAELEILMKKCERDFASFKDELINSADEIRYCVKEGNITLPHKVHVMVDEILVEADKFVSKQESSMEINSMSQEILAGKDEPFVIKAFASDSEFNSLKKLTRAVENKPVLVVIYSSDGFMQGRCVVPKELVSDVFSAEKWMKSFVSDLGGGTVGAPKGQDPGLVALLKRARVQEGHSNIKAALERATEFAQQGTKTIIAKTSVTAPSNV